MSSWTIQEDDQDGYCIQWYNSDEGDLGAYFGDGDFEFRHTANEGFLKPHPDEDDPDWLEAHNLAVADCKAQGIGTLTKMGFTFESKSKAQRALALLRSAAKRIKDDKPWPDWAVKAQAAGWKPPKGWKP